ncbi:unnamed protein product [Cylicocyclus nassatus]|uniref:G-protein coupled receptors family 1 profile domain-containing protein n=1 Tax=Cylicocyclus nassatus TaxID=53992 RepID=A0AA36HBC1_CYLNA|nr:unnamed protein product [Cylicocyclus nassatus]
MTCGPIQYEVPNITSYVTNVMGSRCQSKAIWIPTVITYSIIFIVGAVGNICTCLVIVRNKSMHTHTNFYLLSLALSDLLVLFLGLPMETYAIIDYVYPYEFQEWICKGRAYLIEFTSYASILVICSFTVERWLAICHPLRSQSSPKVSRAYFTVIAMWALSAIAAFPIGVIVKINRLPLPAWAQDQPWTNLISSDGSTLMKTEFCAMDIAQQKFQKQIIYFAFFAFFVIPAFLITMMYSHIALRIASTDSLLCVDKKAERTRASQNVIKMLVSVVVSFFLCWLPFHIQRLLSLYMTYNEGHVSPAIEIFSTLIFNISGCCYYSNSAINPVLYNLFSERYRKAFFRTILGKHIAKRILPEWYQKKSGMPSNAEYTSTHRATNNSSRSMVVSKERLLKALEFKTKAILI